MALNVGGVVGLMKEGYTLIQTPKGLYRLNRGEKWFSLKKTVFDFMRDKGIVERGGQYPDGGEFFKLTAAPNVSPEMFRTGLFIRLGRVLPSIRADEIEIRLSDLGGYSFRFRGRETAAYLDELLSAIPEGILLSDAIVAFFLGYTTAVNYP